MSSIQTGSVSQFIPLSRIKIHTSDTEKVRADCMMDSLNGTIKFLLTFKNCGRKSSLYFFSSVFTSKFSLVNKSLKVPWRQTALILRRAKIAWWLFSVTTVPLPLDVFSAKCDPQTTAKSHWPQAHVMSRCFALCCQRSVLSENKYVVFISCVFRSSTQRTHVATYTTDTESKDEAGHFKSFVQSQCLFIGELALLKFRSTLKFSSASAPKCSYFVNLDHC